MTAEHVRLGLPEPELGKVLIGAYIDPPDRDSDDGRGESRAIGWKPVPSSELAGGGGGGATAADNFLYLGTDAGDPIALTGTDSLATMLDFENDSEGDAFTHANGLITVVEDSMIAISAQAVISAVDSSGYGQFGFDGLRTYTPTGIPRFYLATVPRVYSPVSVQFAAAGTVIDTQLNTGNLAGSRSVTYAEVTVYKIL